MRENSSVCRLKYPYSCFSSHFSFLIVAVLLLLLSLSLHPLQVFTWALVDGLSLEFEWQHVSSSLLNSFPYSGRYKKNTAVEMNSKRPLIFKTIIILLLWEFFLSALAENHPRKFERQQVSSSVDRCSINRCFTILKSWWGFIKTETFLTLTFLRNHLWPPDHLVVSLTSGQGYFTFLY